MITGHVDAQATLDALKTARREMRADLREGIIAAAEEITLPAARANIHTRTGRLAGSLVVRGTARNAYLTTRLRGSMRAMVGLLEFGGIVRTPIRPRKGHRAIRTPYGPRSVVKTPRKYEPQGFMTRAVAETRGTVEERVAAHVEAAVARHLGEFR